MCFKVLLGVVYPVECRPKSHFLTLSVLTSCVAYSNLISHLIPVLFMSITLILYTHLDKILFQYVAWLIQMRPMLTSLLFQIASNSFNAALGII